MKTTHTGGRSYNNAHPGSGVRVRVLSDPGSVHRSQFLWQAEDPQGTTLVQIVDLLDHITPQNEITKLPAFGDLLGQKAARAIRTYIETRPDDGALDDYTDRLKEIRDLLASMADGGEGDAAALQSDLSQIASTVETGSGALSMTAWPSAQLF